MSTIKSSGENLKLSSDNTKDIELQHNGSTKVTVKSDGKVGIGTSSPTHTLTVDVSSGANLMVARSALGTGGVYLESNGTDGNVRNPASGKLHFQTNGNNTRVSVTNDGLTFNGDTAAANALDDYEEGEHIVSITSSSGSITEHSSNKTLRYTKIGDTVTISGRVDVSSVSSPSGQLTISLPFAAGTGEDYHSPVTLFIWAATASETGLWVGWIDSAASVMYLRYGNSGQPVSNVSGYIQAGTEFRIAATYKTA